VVGREAPVAAVSPGYRGPPVKGLKLVGALLGALALGSTGYQHWGSYGATVGVVAGLCLGWIVMWWVTRELFGR
jgi:hypothetical protein